MICYSPKMEFCGIRGISNRLIRSYLSNRYQRVTLNKNSNRYSSYWELISYEFLRARYWDLCFFSYISMISLKLFRTYLHLYYMLMILVLLFLIEIWKSLNLKLILLLIGRINGFNLIYCRKF
jgi:hypothetical protein